MPRTRSLLTRLTPFLLLLAAVAALGVHSASAATFLGDDAIVIEAGETITDNVYAFGATVRVEGTVEGDLIGAGSSILIAESGTVTGDLMAAGESISIEGTVEGDVRSAGYAVHVAPGGQVGGEFVAAGFSVGLLENTEVGNDAIMAGYQGLVDGNLNGDLKFAGGALDITGVVDGDVDAAVDAPTGQGPGAFMAFGQDVDLPRTVNPGLHIGEGEIRGDLSYEASAASDVDEAAVSGAVTFDQVTEAGAEVQDDRPFVVSWLVDFIRHYIALLVVGLLTVAALPRLLGQAADRLAQEPLPSAGWGLVTVAVAFFGIGLTVFAAVLLLALTLGVDLGILAWAVLSAAAVLLVGLTFGMLLAGWLGWIASGLTIGQRLMAQGEPSTGLGDRLPLLLAGLAVIALLISLPVVGGLMKFAVGFVGIGALILTLRRRPTEESAQPAY